MGLFRPTATPRRFHLQQTSRAERRQQIDESRRRYYASVQRDDDEPAPYSAASFQQRVVERGAFRPQRRSQNHLWFALAMAFASLFVIALAYLFLVLKS